ncbi:hypothetical protein CASFOL_002472 [Castilleja foliolosa]|uniref:Uncharacterized protein n=1 Tax=Castilleja foliolosa TaxID=1961234 RepID=A0ABD3EEM4_9LAMI
MRTQQKNQHQPPSRKSPIFSSFHPSIQNPARPKHKPTPKPRPDDAWALSLHVAEHVPLKTFYPSVEEDKPIRRSSRFTANKYKTPGYEDALPERNAPQLLALLGPVSKSTEKSFLSGKRLRSRSVLMRKSLPSNKCLRSRSVKLSAENMKRKDLIELPENPRKSSLRGSSKDSGELEKSAFLSEKHLKSTNVKLLSYKEIFETLPGKSRSSLRRLRKNSDQSWKMEPKKSAYSRSVKMQLQKEISDLKTESKKSAFSGEKCLSSRSVEMELEKGNSEKSGYVLNEKPLLSPKIESVLEELFGISEETDVEKSESDGASEKCVRSRKIKRKINVDENTDKMTGRVDRWSGADSRRSGSREMEVAI